MSETHSYLFLFSLGPVQSFIASARKTQDLWAGSYLLSHLVRKLTSDAVLKILETQFAVNVSVVFPVTAKTVTEYALNPNRFLLHIRDADRDSLQGMGECFKNKVTDEFGEMIAYGKDKITSIAGSAGISIHDNSREQISDFLEIFWVAVPFEESDTYIDRYKAVEAGLAGRKNFRSFGQPNPELTLKCSMCGDRDAVHESGNAAHDRVRSFWKTISSGNHKFSDNEYLCFICLAKRFLPNYFQNQGMVTDTRFPSTAEVALASYKQDALCDEDKSRTREAMRIYETELLKTGGTDFKGKPLPRIAAAREKLGYSPYNALDGIWFLKETIFNCPDSDIKDAYHQFTAEAKSEKLFPNPYYAVLMMDVDKMGDCLNRVENMQRHQEVSQFLARFASKTVPCIVEQDYLGKLIYSGGDDVLAMISLSDLLPVMEALRARFAREFNQEFADLGQFTVSCGVCISHHKNPFSVTLQTAREMIHDAKENTQILFPDSRNSFAVTVLSHSGNYKKALCKWEVDQADQKTALVPQMIKLQQMLQSGILSSAFIYNYKQQFADLLNDSPQVSSPFLQVELSRLMWRATDRQKLKQFGYSDQKARALIKEISEELFKGFGTMNYHLGNFVSLLEIINIIIRGDNI